MPLADISLPIICSALVVWTYIRGGPIGHPRRSLLPSFVNTGPSQSNRCAGAHQRLVTGTQTLSPNICGLIYFETAQVLPEERGKQICRQIGG